MFIKYLNDEKVLNRTAIVRRPYGANYGSLESSHEKPYEVHVFTEIPLWAVATELGLVLKRFFDVDDIRPLAFLLNVHKTLTTLPLVRAEHTTRPGYVVSDVFRGEGYCVIVEYGFDTKATSPDRYIIGIYIGLDRPGEVLGGHFDIYNSLIQKNIVKGKPPKMGDDYGANL